MRCWLSRLLVVAVCLSVLFSSLSYAHASEIYEGEEFGSDYPVMTLDENVDTSKGNYIIRYNFGYGSYSESSGEWTKKSFLLSKNVYDNKMQGYTDSVTFDRVRPDGSNVFSWTWSDQFVIQRTDQLKIAKEGQSLKFSVKGFKQNLIGINKDGGAYRNSYMDVNGIHSVMLYVYGDDAEGIRVLHVPKADISKYITIEDEFMTISAEIDGLPCDVYKVNVMVCYGGMAAFNNNKGNTALTSTYWDPAVKLQKVWGYSEDCSVVFSTDDNTAGLLSSIIGFIKSILEGIINIFGKISDFALDVASKFGELFSKLGGWFENLFNKLIELPGKIWNVFETGLKALFVPDADYITGFTDDFKVLLSDRFGFLYDTGELVSDTWNEIKDTGTNGKIYIPATTVDLAGSDFTFGGWNVDLVPEKFEFLLTMIKALTSAFATVLFVNGMKNKFTRLMEGKE